MNVTIGTFNILDPDFATRHRQSQGLIPGTNTSNWSNRKDLVVKTITDANLDILCIQEISETSLKEIQSDLKKDGYAVEWSKHNGRKDGLAILYKEKKFTKEGLTTPSVSSLTEMILDLKTQEGKTIRVANCHLLGGADSPAGKKQIENLINEVEKNTPPGKSPIIARFITGDFNEDSKNANQKLTAIRAQNYLCDDKPDTDDKPGIITEKPNPKNPKGRHIDWIWTKLSSDSNPKIQNLFTHLDFPDHNASDHYLTAAKVSLPSIEQKAEKELTLPVGSFREKIGRHFKLTELPEQTQKEISNELEKILNKHAKDKPFLALVRNDLNLYLKNLNGIDNQKVLSAFEKAVTDAQSEALRTKPKPPQMPRPELIKANPSPVGPSTPPVENLSPPAAVPPVSQSQKSSTSATSPAANKGFGLKVKAFFRTLFSPLTRLFRFIFRR